MPSVKDLTGGGTPCLPCILLTWCSIATLVSSTKLPLIVFQHQGIHYPTHDLLQAIIAGHSSSPPDYYHHHFVKAKHVRTLYQVGETEKELPECEPWAVCSKVDVYQLGAPWVERQCRCANNQRCPGLLSPNDGHTITDRTRQFKLCEPVKKLPKCRYFRDVTWTLTSGPDNVTTQVVHCHCPKGSVAYLIKRQAFQDAAGAVGYNYSFACSPQSRLRCQRKEPCRLFTVRKRLELLDEVNTNTLCQCPHGHRCPRHHSDPGVIQGKSYLEENIRTYSGYCVG